MRWSPKMCQGTYHILSTTFRRPKGTQRQWDVCPFADHGVSSGKSSSLSLSLSTWKNATQSFNGGLHMAPSPAAPSPNSASSPPDAPQELQASQVVTAFVKGSSALKLKKVDRDSKFSLPIWRYFFQMLWIWEFGTLSHESFSQVLG